MIIDSLGNAIAIAAEVHNGQFDKANEDYILHPLAVMQMVAPKRDAMIVAVLHDALEDVDGVIACLALGDRLDVEFSTRILVAINTLTHKPGQSYADYIEEVAGNHLATVVKIADLQHNMDPRRIPADQIVDKDFQRWEKYRKAMIRLQRGPNG